MEGKIFECAGFTFFSNFDSANLARVELVPKKSSGECFTCTTRIYTSQILFLPYVIVNAATYCFKMNVLDVLVIIYFISRVVIFTHNTGSASSLQKLNEDIPTYKMYL